MKIKVKIDLTELVLGLCFSCTSAIALLIPSPLSFAGAIWCAYCLIDYLQDQQEK